MTTEQKVDDLKTHLAVVKQSPSDKIDEDFYTFMLKAKDELGQNSYSMAQFYFEYGNFILQKVENNLQIFNEGALPDNVHQSEEDLVEDIPEEFDESEEPEFPNKEGEEPLNDQPEIVNDEPEGPQEQKEVMEAGDEQEADDKEVIIMNFEMARRLYEEEWGRVKNGQSNIDVNEVMNGVRKCLVRLADLYSIDEDYDKAIEAFQKAIDIEAQRDGFDYSRLVASIYFQKATCYCNQNGENCEVKAINQFLQAFNILLNHLNLVLGYNIINFDLPSQERPKVDRFCYLCLAGDSEQVKEIKEILSSILDKIEDTHSQIAIKEAYLKEKKKLQEETKESEFKPVEDPSKVVHLGSFGNRKKRVEETPQQPKEKESTEKKGAKEVEKGETQT